MLFESANQGIIFCAFISFGFCYALIDELFKTIKSKFSRKFLKHFVDFFRGVIFFLIYFITLCVLNFGLFRLFTLVGFTLGFMIERFFIRKHIFSAINFCRNKILARKIKKEKEGWFETHLKRCISFGACNLPFFFVIIYK